MDFSHSLEEEAFRRELRAFLDEEWPEELRGGVYLAGPAHTREFSEKEKELRLKLGAKGWLGLAIPKEYGGEGRSIMDQVVFADEMSYYGAPYSQTAIGFVAPTLLRYGSESQKTEILPRIARGEIGFCLGFSEPDAGSDLAGLQTSATRDGDDFVIGGQKVYTTYADIADYMFLAARTDREAVKHKGISLFILDMRSPGVTVTPMWTMGDGYTNEVFLDSVRASRDSLVGEVDRGWHYLTTTLDFERFNGFPLGGIRRLFDVLVSFVREGTLGATPLREIEWVRHGIAQVSAQLEAATALQNRVAWIAASGKVPSAEASTLKILASETESKLVNFAARVLGSYGAIKENSPLAPLSGRIERASRNHIMHLFAGGTNEIQRNIIALRGLGLPAT